MDYLGGECECLESGLNFKFMIAQMSSNVCDGIFFCPLVELVYQIFAELSYPCRILDLKYGCFQQQ